MDGKNVARDLLNHAIDRLHETGRIPVPCKICGCETKLFDVVDFNKSCTPSLYPLGLASIPVFYRICLDCQFIFTDFFDGFSSEQWQRYVYNDDYTKIDPEYLDRRPLHNAAELASLLLGRKRQIIGLDYGGGNGKTAELLRQRGWAYDTYDPFGHTDMVPERVGRYNFCSAFEVFEHTPDPIKALGAIVERASPDRLIVLISTGIHDSAVSLQTRLAWWYAAPRNGHASLFSRKSLRILGTRFGLDYTAVSNGTHLLSRNISNKEAIWLLLRGKMLKRLRIALARR